MTVIPDSIEPADGWRTWRFDGTHLRSHNGEVWNPGEALAAKCPISEGALRWTLERGSLMTLAEARKSTAARNEAASRLAISTFRYHPVRWMVAPTVEPPPGYGYTAVADKHDAPDPGCSCGIYAVSTRDLCPSGDVLGKVKLWGTVIPGERGLRSQYAYPAELHVPERLASQAGLRAYGVPIVTDESVRADLLLLPFPDRFKWTRRTMWIATGLNLGAAAVNISHIAGAW